MHTATSSRINEPLRRPWSALLVFVLITFSITWGTIALYVFQPERMVALVGELSGHHPLYRLCTYAPAIAAVSIVLYLTGIDGLTSFLGRLLLWRCPLGWVAFLLIGMPLVFVAGSLVKGNLFGEPFPFNTLTTLLSAMWFMLFLGPVEELGWRGMVLPMLQRYMAPLWAGLLIGAVWGVWHLPAFYLSTTVFSTWSFTPFLIGTMCLSVIVTPLFNASRGSILLPALFHFQAMNPMWPDAQPYDTWFFVAVAVVIVWINRRTMFTRSGSVIVVVPSSTTGTSDV